MIFISGQLIYLSVRQKNNFSAIFLGELGLGFWFDRSGNFGIMLSDQDLQG